MAPFYLKEGENWGKWGGEPKDIRDGNGKDFGVSIYKVEDPEQIQVSVAVGRRSYVIGERGTVIFPGQSTILNRDDFEVVDASTRKTLAKIIHREKPIGGK